MFDVMVYTSSQSRGADRLEDVLVPAQQISKCFDKELVEGTGGLRVVDPPLKTVLPFK